MDILLGNQNEKRISLQYWENKFKLKIEINIMNLKLNDDRFGNIYFN